MSFRKKMYHHENNKKKFFISFRLVVKLLYMRTIESKKENIHSTHLLYFAIFPLFIVGAFTRPLLMHDKSNLEAKSFVI